MQKKEGFPETNEIVICTVTKIQHHSVFCTLDEYGKSGMLHISEISAGRIRNITEYVKEGKTIICKVLQINKEKGYIDLSLRRVTEAQKKSKASNIKKEQFTNKILELAATEAKIDVDALSKELEANKGDFESLFDLFQAVVESGEKIPLSEPALSAVKKIVLEKMKPVSVTIKGKLEIVTYEPNGVELIHDAFSKTKLVTSYLGGGKYSIDVTAKDYKKAESILKTELDALMKPLEKKTAKLEFERTDR